MAEDEARQNPKDEQSTATQVQQPAPAQFQAQQQPSPWQGQAGHQTASPLPTPQDGSPAKTNKTVTISRIGLILLIAGIVLALVVGWFAGVAMSSQAVVDAQQQAATSEADRKKAAKAYDQLITEMQKQSQQQSEKQQKEADQKTLVVTGGRWAGAMDNGGSGYRHAYITVRNDGTQAIGNVIVTASKLDAGGRITGETTGFLQSAIQPGQSADVEIMIEPGNDNMVAIQPTAIAINDPNGYISYQIDAEKIAVTN